jgi:hypothetical protein
VARLCAFFDELEERRFDEAIERGAEAGKLDKLMAEAKAKMDAGIGEEFWRPSGDGDAARQRHALQGTV